ncbi:MAG: hypothetical protein AB7N80_14595 [Bdellovibrionales bacterium]
MGAIGLTVLIFLTEGPFAAVRSGGDCDVVIMEGQDRLAILRQAVELLKTEQERVSRQVDGVWSAQDLLAIREQANLPTSLSDHQVMGFYASKLGSTLRREESRLINELAGQALASLRAANQDLIDFEGEPVELLNRHFRTLPADRSLILLGVIKESGYQVPTALQLGAALKCKSDLDQLVCLERMQRHYSAEQFPDLKSVKRAILYGGYYQKPCCGNSCGNCPYQINYYGDGSQSFPSSSEWEKPRLILFQVLKMLDETDDRQ